MKKVLVALLTAVLILGLEVSPSAAGKKKKPKPVVLEESGTIVASNPIGQVLFGITEGEFTQVGMCSGIPQTQGVDGWIIELPEAFTTSGGEVKLQGSGSAVPHDLAIYFYDTSCGLMNESSLNGGADEAGLIPPGAAWIVIDALVGLNTSFTLTASSLV